MSKIPSRIAGYTVLRSLGSGVTGEVFLGHDAKEVRVAIKTCSPKISKKLDWAERCNDEVTHKNLIKYREIKFDSRYKYLFISDYLEVSAISWDLLKPVPYGDMIEVLLKVAKALEAMHKAGMHHGNVKPSNVLLRRRKGVFLPLLSDVGVAYLYDEKKFADEAVIRAVYPYLAPEILAQFHGRGEPEPVPPTARGDIYSFAAMVVETFCRRSPFLPRDEISFDGIMQLKKQQKYRIIIKNDPTTVLDIRRLNDLVRKSLDPEPTRRPSSMSSVVQELEACMDKGRAPALA